MGWKICRGYMCNCKYGCRKGLTEKRHLSKDQKEVRKGLMWMSGEHELSRGKSKCKGTEVGWYLACSRNSREACAPGTERTKGRGGRRQEQRSGRWEKEQSAGTGWRGPWLFLGVR